LQNADESPLQVWVEEHVGLIEHENRCVSVAPDVEEQLQPDLEAVTGPVEFLLHRAARVRVVDINPDLAVSETVVHVKRCELYGVAQEERSKVAKVVGGVGFSSAQVVAE